MICKINLFLFCIITICVQSLYANIQFGGYLQNDNIVAFGEKEEFTITYSCRLESAWDFDNRGGIEAHFVIDNKAGALFTNSPYKDGSLGSKIMNELLANMLGNLDTNVTSQIGGLSQNTLGNLVNSSFFPKTQLTIDRALLKLYFKKFDLFIGKQVIAWGTGYAFNPTDIWNIKNASDPTAGKSGTLALRAEIPFGSVSGLTLAVIPGKNFKTSSGGFRVKMNAGRFDFSLSGMSVMNVDRELIELPRKIIGGVDAVGQIGNVGVWVESAFTNPITNDKYFDFEHFYIQSVLGLDYTFENGIKVLGEYYYNGLGESCYKDYSANDFVLMTVGDMSGMGMHYGAFMINKAFENNITLSGLSLWNFTDISTIIVPSIEYLMHDNLSVKLTGMVGLGKKEKTEYGSLKSNTSFVVAGYF